MFWQHLDTTLELAFRGSVMASEAADRRADGLFSLPRHPSARFISLDLPDAQVHRYQSNFNHSQHIACSHTSSIEHRWHPVVNCLSPICQPNSKPPGQQSSQQQATTTARETPTSVQHHHCTNTNHSSRDSRSSALLTWHTHTQHQR
jgi:hypothetical protein